MSSLTVSEVRVVHRNDRVRLGISKRNYFMEFVTVQCCDVHQFDSFGME